MADKDYKRPKFHKTTHIVRNIFITIAALIIISLGVFIYIGYSSSQKTTAPIAEKVVNNKTVNETIHSDSSKSNATSSHNDQQSDQSSNSSANSNSSDSQSESSSSASSSSASSRSEDKDKSDIEASAHLKGKKISEAIAWAKAHNRYYSWSITSGGDDAVVTSVTDDGHNISFVASAK
ncbi:hypothetical protein [Leuconostoc rapi]|uniref:hypothetical protein n=1 Tax=Leuconostoc rapi TaxID=1406906 RepID=UPI00195CC772|nr:hypothetical protein [Leuconostoc rapi]MBM7435025.1 ABC-type multidrug transport system ATPase subunit [Leuconostoc rapi]